MMQEQIPVPLAAGPLQTQLIDGIYESLQNHMPANATFLAERLLAERDSEQSRSILAQCYMAENKHYKVFHVLRDCKSQQNKYKFAVSCVKINKFKQAEKALLSDVSKTNLTSNICQSIPNGSNGLYLLGVITEKQQRFNEAKEYFKQALQLNPTLWMAYQKLGKLGEHVTPNKVFTDNKMKNYELNKKLNSKGKKKDELSQTADQRFRRTQYNLGLSKRKSSSQTTEFQFPNLMALLKKLADGYYNLCYYNCQEAIQQFKKLPLNHFNTGWVLTNVGRAHMEIVKYAQAATYYEQAYKLEPYRLEGVDYYSSCLWHLKKQVELCYLAHQSLEKSLYTPESWIAVGNCFSLQKEHQQALKFFNRAIQLNPHNPYAHSLCGHEFVYNQDFGKAKKSFENALNLDVRHYSAWWGLGNITYKQERYDKAAENFNKAIAINPKNPVLYSFMGMTLAAKRDFNEALKFFEQSQGLDPKNGLNRFQKANTLVKLQRYETAIQELENLEKMMPKEAPIPMLLGKIYKKLAKTEKAHYYFSLALDLQSKDAQKIKGFIESLHSTGNDGDEMEI